MDADPEVAAFEAITRSLLHSIAAAADGGDLNGTPRQAVEAVALCLLGDVARGLPDDQRHVALRPIAQLVGSFLDEVEREPVAG